MISILFIFNFNMLFGINNCLYYTHLISYIYDYYSYYFFIN